MANPVINDSVSLRRKLSAIEEIIDEQERTFYALRRELSELLHSLPRELTSVEVQSLFGRLTTFIHSSLPILSTLFDDIRGTEDRLDEEWRTSMVTGFTRLVELEAAARKLLGHYAYSVEKRPHFFLVEEVGANLIKWFGNYFEFRITPCRELRTELRRRLRGIPAEKSLGKQSAKRGRPSTAERDIEIFKKIESGESTRKQIAEDYDLKSNSVVSHAFKRGKDLSSNGITISNGPCEAPDTEAMVEINGQVLLPDGTPSQRARLYILRKYREAVSKDGKHSVRIGCNRQPAGQQARLVGV